ncbi:MAG TPA: outer membrane protein assembly factor BamD [Desulfuromonadaceae bacterium]
MKTVARAAAIALLSAALLQGCAAVAVNKPPEVLFKDGEEAFRRERYEDAIASWKKVKESYKSPELSTKAELGIADAYFLNKDYIEAAAAYEDFRKLHPAHERAAYALYRQGVSYYNEINRIDTDQTPVKNALSVFESYLKQYPKGENAAEAAEKVSDCKDRQVQYEIYVGTFYFRTDKYAAAIARFEEALKAFPHSARREELLYKLELAYLEAGQKAKAREAYERLVAQFPASPFRADAQERLGK